MAEGEGGRQDPKFRQIDSFVIIEDLASAGQLERLRTEATAWQRHASQAGAAVG